MGRVGRWGAPPPASKKITRPGAAVRCASIAAAQGTPVPTATVRPSSSKRAAQQIINSIELYGVVIVDSSSLRMANKTTGRQQAHGWPSVVLAPLIQKELLPSLLLHSL